MSKTATLPLSEADQRSTNLRKQLRQGTSILVVSILGVLTSLVLLVLNVDATTATSTELNGGVAIAIPLFMASAVTAMMVAWELSAVKWSLNYDGPYYGDDD